MHWFDILNDNAILGLRQAEWTVFRNELQAQEYDGESILEISEGDLRRYGLTKEGPIKEVMSRIKALKAGEHAYAFKCTPVLPRSTNFFWQDASSHTLFGLY